jgi:uncharacterized protein YuzE
MQVTCDATLDIVRILLNETPIAESDEDKPGVILDYAADGSLVGMEILDASRRMSHPERVEYAVIGAH